MSLTNRYLFSIQSESAYGTDAFSSSDPTDYFTVFGQPSLLEEYTEVADELVRANSSRDSGLRYKNMTSVSFEAPMLAKSNSAGTAPDFISDILKASGLEETVNAGTDVTYTPKTAGGMGATPSMTAFFAIRDDETGDYYKRVTKGIHGNTTITLNQGEEARVSFEGMGLFSTMGTTAVSATEPSSYNKGQDRFRVQDLTFTYNSTEYDVTSLELNLNQSAQADQVLNASEETDEIYLATSHDAPVLSVGFKGRSSEVADILSKVQPNADGTLILNDVTITATMGTDTIEMNIPNAKLPMYTETVNNSRYQFDMDLLATSPLSNPGDDELSIKFT